MLVDLEGEVVKGVFTGEDVLVQQYPGTEEIGPLELREWHVVLDVAVLLTDDPGEAAIGIKGEVFDVRR